MEFPLIQEAKKDQAQILLMYIDVFYFLFFFIDQGN